MSSKARTSRFPHPILVAYLAGAVGLSTPACEKSRVDTEAPGDDSSSADDEYEKETVEEDSGKRDGAPSNPGEASTRDAASDAASKASDSLWCNAVPVFKQACQSCHNEHLESGAPMALVTHEDFMRDAPSGEGKVYEVVSSRVHADTKRMPPRQVLRAEELEAIDDWIADGAKAGPDSQCGGLVTAEPTPAPQADWPPPGCEKIYKITAGTGGAKATIARGAEINPEFILDPPWTEPVQALGFRPITDNKKVLHHWILYEEKEPDGAFLAGWAPGGDETKLSPLPADVGIYMPTGPGSLKLEMHYYNALGMQDEQDASGVEICTTTKFRKHSATTFTEFGTIPLLLPGRETDTVATCNVNVTQPVYLLSDFPHAHKLATWMKLVVRRGGQDIVLRDEEFNFEEQTARTLEEPFELKTGDQVITTCRYRNDTNRLVIFGESSDAEMCFNFAMYYPMGALRCGR
jgi:hypothetical protein